MRAGENAEQGNFASRARGLALLSILSVVIGVVGGLGAWCLRQLIAVVHNGAFLGHFSFAYDSTLHTPASPLGPFVIAVPFIGAIVVAWIVKNVAPEAKGHGVPEVMDAIHYHDGRIRPIVALAKAVASAISIGTGGSVGREGPLIQIGAALGSTAGQIVSMPTHQRITLVAAGAAAGIAAAFNTPLAAIAFAIELLLLSVNAANVLSVSLASVTATFVGRSLVGLAPTFDIPALQIPSLRLGSPAGLALAAIFGALMGLVCVAFIRGLYWAEDRFESLPDNLYFRHGLGMLAVGVMIFGLQRLAGHYYVEGVGYATITEILAGRLMSPGFLVFLCGAKLLATCLTLGSGASGGVFSPSLFMGAALGAAFGHATQHLFPWMPYSPSVFAVAGMAAMIGGVTGALLTAVMMSFEMTMDYNAILVTITAAAVAFAVRKRWSPESIYTLKLLRRGHVVPEGLQAAFESARTVRDVMTEKIRTLDAFEPLGAYDGATIVTREGRPVAVFGPLLYDHGGAAGDVGPLPFIVVPPSADLVATLRAMDAADADLAVVSRDPASNNGMDVVGVVTAREIARASRRRARLL